MIPETLDFRAHTYLYHYQSFDPTKRCDRDRLRMIISGRKLHFSNPSVFNDPWDCRPYYDFSTLSNPEVRDRHIEWYKKITRRKCQNINEKEIQRRADKFKNDSDLFKSRLKEIAPAHWQEICENYRVYCLSSKPEIELMWAHYSYKHQGLCLKFKTRNTLFCGAWKMIYAEEYPRMDITDDSGDENRKPFITKSDAWEYEGEYRLLARESNAASSDGTLISEYNYVDLPDGALAGIIVGCMASNETVNTIRELVNRSKGQIELLKAEQADDKYELTIVDI